MSNVVAVSIYGKNSAGTSTVINAWDTSAITIKIPKTVDTSKISTSNSTTSSY